MDTSPKSDSQLRSLFRSAVHDPDLHNDPERQYGQREPLPANQQVYRRNSALAPDSLDENERRVRSVLTTEDPALVYDYRSGRVIYEVLLADGCEYEDQTPLIRDHNQYTVNAIVGSVVEHSVERDSIDGWLCFGDNLDEQAEGIWRRVAQGHLRRVSVGYDYTVKDYMSIVAGETATVAGRSFTAPDDRDLRVVFRWRLREVSLVVIPADPRAQMRSENVARGTDESSGQEFQTQTAPTDPQGFSESEEAMKKFLQFLHKHGLAKNVTGHAEALRWAADGNLTDAQLNELSQLCKSDGVDFDRAAAVAKRSSENTGTRSDSTTTDDQTPVNGQRAGSGSGTQSGQSGQGERGQLAADSVTAADLQRTAADAIRIERERIAAIRSLHADHPEIPETVVRQAESEGWDLDRTRSEFLTAMRAGRQEGANPAIHTRASSDINIQVLTAALLEREGITPDSDIFNTQLIDTVARRREFNAAWLRGGASTASQESRDAFNRAFDVVSQRGLRNASMMRIAEALFELETGQRSYDDTEIFEHAFGQRSQSSGGYTAVFGSVVHMVMLASYQATAATYESFCQVVDVGDFRTHSTADMGAVGRLKRQGKNGGKAPLLNIDDPVLNSIAAERYAGMLKLNDRMFIDDTLGVTGFLPAELGETCRQLPSDLALAQVMRTDNLSDSKTRYNVTDGNVISAAAFDEAALTALGVALTAKKVGDRRIRIDKGILLAGATLGPVARKQMKSQTISEAHNPHAGSYQVVEDTGIDLGVSDPAQDDAAIAGTPNAIYAFAGNTNGKAPIKVAFRRGTNRGPVTRSGMLTEGEWGMYWDVYMDVGAAFQRRTGTVKVNITG